MNLDEMELAVRADLAYPGSDEATHRMLRNVQALIWRVRELHFALDAAVFEIVQHNEEYGHVTPKVIIGQWNSLIEKALVLE